jgi:hypothetical protein
MNGFAVSPQVLQAKAAEQKIAKRTKVFSNNYNLRFLS